MMEERWRRQDGSKSDVFSMLHKEGQEWWERKEERQRVAWEKKLAECSFKPFFQAYKYGQPRYHYPYVISSVDGEKEASEDVGELSPPPPTSDSIGARSLNEMEKDNLILPPTVDDQRQSPLPPPPPPPPPPPQPDRKSPSTILPQASSPPDEGGYLQGYLQSKSKTAISDVGSPSGPPAS